MAAHQHQSQRVISRRTLSRACDHECIGSTLFALPASTVAAPLVDQVPVSHGQEPRPRMFGNALARPLTQRRDDGFLYGVLTCIELPVAPGEGSDDLRRQLPQQLLD
jgi:hypothetical protein